MRLGVLIAVEAEAAAILGDGFFSWRPSGGGRLESATRPISLMLTGVGKAYAARAAALLARDCGPLCALGTGGGLGDERVGDLVLGFRFLEHDMDISALGFARGVTPYGPVAEAVFGTASEPTRTLALRALSSAGLSAEEGVVASGDRFISDPLVAEDLRLGYGARVSDMESAAAAKVALMDGRDFFTLRWVSDGANRSSAADWAANVRSSGETFRLFLRALAALL